MRHRPLRVGFVALVLAVCALVPALAGGLAIRGVTLSDNGDGDGFADTHETVEMRLTVQNTSGADLTGVSAGLTAQQPQLACLSVTTIDIGDLADGEIALTEPFVFTVSEVDRSALGLGALDELTAVFDLAIVSQPEHQPALPSRITLDLDLDVGGGAGPTSFVESFESATLGAFEVQNIDAGKHSLEASAGFRCRQNDPNQYCVTCDPVQCFLECFLGATASQAESQFWNVSGPGVSPDNGRAFSGFHSLFFGVDLGPPKHWTTPLASLEGAATTEPINIGWDGVAPTLSFMHQVSFVDARTLTALDSAVDRGIVMAQLADADGDPVGRWIKLDPYQNVYDQNSQGGFIGDVCMFDPVDDGSTEEEHFPDDYCHGPSSTCFPESVFANAGETSSPFDPDNVGLADGPGLQGMWGIGTWIETAFDLSRFRGRRIRLRFLATTLKVGVIETWEEYLQSNPIPGDDGWWIDDVTVSGALSSPAAVTVDDKDNGALPGAPGIDLDGDGLHDVCDNCLLAPNADQTDEDLDGLGDACDLCPADPTDPADLDCDGISNGVDNCATAYNPEQGSFVRLVDSMQPFFAIDPESSTVVYTTVGGDQLRSVSRDGGVSVQLAGPVGHYGFDFKTPYRISPDGERVVYVADQEFELYSVPISGGPATKLDTALNEFWVHCIGEPCDPFSISASSSIVVYQVYSHDAGGSLELYSAPISGGTATRINAAGMGVCQHRISPDSSTVVYLGYSPTGYVLMSVPIEGAESTQLNADGTVSTCSPSARGFLISPDSTTVVYLADASDVRELYSVPIGGGPSIKLNGPLADDFATLQDRFDISSDSSTVVYRVAQDTAGMNELYSVPIGGGPPGKLNGELIPTGHVLEFAISPDGGQVVYRAHQDSTSSELYSVPITGGSPVKLNGELVAGGEVTRFEIGPDGAAVVFVANADVLSKAELYSVPIGGGTPTKLNGPLFGNISVIEFRISPDASTVAYRTDRPDAHDLFTVPIGGGPPTQHDGTLTILGEEEFVEEMLSGDFGLEPSFAFTHDGSAVVYLAAVPSPDDTAQLFGSRLDADPDGDGQLFACDVCPGVFDPDQADGDGDTVGDVCDCAPGDVGSFDHPEEVRNIRLPDKITLQWDSAAAQSGFGTRYDVLRGDVVELPVGSGPTEACLVGDLSDTGTEDLEVPGASRVFYYLVRGANTCGVGTYGIDSASNERLSAICP